MTALAFASAAIVLSLAALWLLRVRRPACGACRAQWRQALRGRWGWRLPAVLHSCAHREDGR